MYSIKIRLVSSLLLVLALTTLCAGIGTYFSVQYEVDKLLDDSLKQVALSLRTYRFQDILRFNRNLISNNQNVVIQIFDPISGLRFLSRDMEYLPVPDRVGFSDILLDGKPWRVYTTQNPQGQIIEATQPTSIRSEMAMQAAKPIMIPLLILLPIVGFLISVIVTQGFSSLSRTAEAIARRSPTSLTPLSLKGLPIEIAPMVTALNELLARLGESISAQKRFASDAAHELRTPLTAIQLQIQLAERAKTDEMRQKAMERLKEGVKRATRLVTQLLTMARLDPDNSNKPMLPVDLNQLNKSIAEDLSLIAMENKHIDLKAVDVAPAVVMGNEDALRLVVTNLCDNAIRYTPENGHIELSAWIEGDNAVLQVADDGPGISESEKERIFERFYRAEGTQTIPGTGIGLAIVRRVAELHGGRPSVHTGLNGKGAAFRITIPTSPKIPEPIVEADTE
ncbi:MAG: ATP-binding protein [Burkholderiales bacterium]|nr:ATP-binding protein [Burkholderiales bacterium]